jgi:glycosyltransferase involved in cell wall biosynthesis
MTVWVDVTTLMSWTRPVVGVVRTEFEIVKYGLSSFDTFFFIFQGDGVRQISHSQVAATVAKLEGAKTVAESDAETPTKSEVLVKQPRRQTNLRERLGSLRNTYYFWALRRKPLTRLLLMYLGLSANSALNFLNEVSGVLSRALRDLRDKTRSEKIIYSYHSGKSPQGSAAPSPFPEISAGKCSGSCKWAIFSPGDYIFSGGLLWDNVELANLYSEKLAHKFIFLAMCYDTIPAKSPHLVPENFSTQFKKYLCELVWAADHLVCISESTQSDIRALASQQGLPVTPSTSVIRLGSHIQDSRGTDKPDLLLAQRPYVLFVSTIEKRKNHSILLKVIEALNHDLGSAVPEFIFVGMRGWNVDELYRDLRLNPLLRRIDGEPIVRILEHVDDQELTQLYRHALFTVFPSLSEGWGLPVSESLALGTPVIASSHPAIVEASQGLAVHLDPNDYAAWTSEIRRCITDESHLSQLRLQTGQFSPLSWDAFASGVFDLFDSRKKLKGDK